MGNNDAAVRRIKMALVICTIFTSLEFFGGLYTGSLAIMTDAAHMFCDSSGFLLSWIAIRMASRPPTDTFTLGFQQVEALGALFSMVMVWFAVAFIMTEGYERIRDVPEIEGRSMFYMAVLALGLNLILLATLGHEHHGHSHAHAHGPSHDDTAPHTHCNRLVSQDILPSFNVKRGKSDHRVINNIVSPSNRDHDLCVSDASTRSTLAQVRPDGQEQPERLSLRRNDHCLQIKRRRGSSSSSDPWNGRSQDHHHEHSHDHEHTHSHDHGHAHSHDHGHTQHGHAHSHDHGHEHTHGHAHSHDHGHAQHGHAHSHDHGHCHDHGHTHSHDHEHDFPLDLEHGHSHGHGCQGHKNMALSAAVVHVMGDILQSIGVIFAASVIWLQPFDIGSVATTTGVVVSRWNYMDPFCSIIFGVLVMYSTWHTTKKSVQMLILRAPEDLKVPKIRRRLQAMDEVDDVRDVTCFVIGSQHLFINATLVIYDGAPSNQVVRKASAVLAQMGATKSTIQVVDRSFYADSAGRATPLLKEDGLEVNFCDAI